MQYLLLSKPPPNLNTTTNAVGFDIYMTLHSILKFDVLVFVCCEIKKFVLKMFLVSMQYLLLSKPSTSTQQYNAVGFDIYMTLQ